MSVAVSNLARMQRVDQLVQNTTAVLQGAPNWADYLMPTAPFELHPRSATPMANASRSLGSNEPGLDLSNQ